MRDLTRVSMLLLVAWALAACGPSGRKTGGGDDTGDDDSSTCPRCSDDKYAVIDCDGNATQCPPDQQCNSGMCMNACDAAERNHSSVGCDYMSVDMDAADGPPREACYTVFVANTSPGQAHINAEWNGAAINLGQFARIPVGTGQSLTYGGYDPNAGLAPGQVAILFLAYSPAGGPLMGNVTCPVPAAIGAAAQVSGNGFGHAFHISTDLPVVAYQMLPYGGGKAAATGASLLVPTSAWGTNYIAVSAYDPPAGQQAPISFAMGPSYNIVAKEDETHVTIRPNQKIVGGGGVPATDSGQSMSITLSRGNYVQITQSSGMSGSPISADKPIGVFGGHQIMSIDRCCGDHGEQMLTPVQALGSEYVAAPHGDREPNAEARIYRIYGAVDETHLTYDPPNAGPAVVNQGAMLEIRTATPFSVRAQDDQHPFAMFTYMSGAGVTDPSDEGYDPNFVDGAGDADFVRLVPPKQFLYHYVFFTDPTYPFTTLTVVRKQKGGEFKDVKLECSGAPVTGWQPVGGDGAYEMAFVKLADHFNGVGGCNNGVHTMDSEGQFGVWVWGWGTESTSTGWVSYGYPAGEGVQPINNVVILAEAPENKVFGAAKKSVKEPVDDVTLPGVPYFQPPWSPMIP